MNGPFMFTKEQVEAFLKYNWHDFFSAKDGARVVGIDPHRIKHEEPSLGIKFVVTGTTRDPTALRMFDLYKSFKSFAGLTFYEYLDKMGLIAPSSDEK